MSGYTLGLDLGPSSIGWAVVDVEGGCVRAAGVRVFPEGVNRERGEAEKSKNADRREKRGQRRQVARRAARRRRVRELLRGAGMWSDEGLERSVVDPLALRRRGLDARLTLEEFGVALYHLAKRRGFKSNRKAGNADEEGVVYEGISRLRQEMDAAGSRTLGEFLAGLRADPHVRIRKRYTLRAMYEAEFEELWTKQAGFHGAVLTGELRGRVRDALFFQRPLRPVPLSVVGRCALEPKERRGPVAHRVAQRFRMVKEVNNLRVGDGRGEERTLTAEERVGVLALLGRHNERTFDQIRKKLGLPESQRFNLERGERGKLKGHETDAVMRKAKKGEVFGKGWDGLAETVKDAAVEAVLSVEDPAELTRRGMEEWGLSADAAGRLAGIRLRPGYARLSLKAMKKLLEHMKPPHGKREDEAAALCGYGRIEGPPLDRLPKPPEEIKNPIVRGALFQVRRVVNAIIGEYGKPAAVHVELAREAKGSLREREERTKEMRARQKERAGARCAIEDEWAIHEPSRGDIERYLLWKDFNRTCPYTGEGIGAAELFGPDVQVDHILPYDRSLDDSYGNKVVCLRRANDEKGNRTPREWLGGDPERYDRMLNCVRHLWSKGQRGKQVKFSREGVDLEDFLARQLNDTAYISREVAGYLRRLGADVVFVRGGTTAELRWRWGLDAVLRDDGLALKNREDHRHHAVDAVVVALTTRRHLQNLARGGKGPGRRDRAAVDGHGLELPRPWEGFREEVECVVGGINVSHRARRKVWGPLHEETIYGKTEKVDEFVYRKPLESLTLSMVSNIRDGAIRRLVEARLGMFGVDLGGKSKIPGEVWKEPLWMTGGKAVVKKVRLTRRDDTIRPIRGGAALVKPGSVHHLAVFEVKDARGRDRLDVEVVDMIDAADRIRKGEAVISRRHSTDPRARFVTSLSMGEMVLLVHNGNEGLYRFETVAGTSKQMWFRHHTYAGKSSSTKGQVSKMPGTLKAKKVTVDLLGRVRDADRKLRDDQADDRDFAGAGAPGGAG